MGAWTDEYLDLMIQKLSERKQKERGHTPDPEVSVETLAAKSRGMIRVVKQ